MKKLFALLLVFAAALLCGTEIKNLKTFSVSGIPGTATLPATLDGETLLVYPVRQSGAQTIRVRLRYPGNPAGVLLSRFRAENGMRGYEAGFAGKTPYLPTGSKPSLLLSGGNKQTDSLFLNSAPLKLPSETELEYILRFLPGKALRFDLFQAQNGTHLCSGKADSGAIGQLSPRAGEGLLAIGGRRIHSRKGGYFAPAGTVILALSVFDRALDNAELASLYRIKFPPEPSKPVTRYVNKKTGNDANDGLSLERPFATIQKAADSVNPGDTILIAPGIYYENVVLMRGGTENAPVTFRADNRADDRVILTAADETVREKKIIWKLEDAKNRIYSIPFPHFPARILYDGTDLFGGYLNVDGLRGFTLNDGYPGPFNGYTYDEKAKRLYVRLHTETKYGSPNPNDHVFAIAPPSSRGANGHHLTSARDANLFIRISGKANIIIDGFTFETPSMTGVGTLAEQVIVRNCRFKGCRFGVFGGRGGNGVFVENCVYDQFPVFQETCRIIQRHQGTAVAEKFRFYFWSYKGKGFNYSKHPVKNYETGIIGGVRSNWHVRDCIVEDTFEGFSSWCVSSAKHLRVYGNIFRRVVDNAVETENNAEDIRVYGNLFEDCAEAVSWQPLTGLPWPGPVFVYRNLFIDTPALEPLRKALGGHPGIFKLGAAGQNWTYAHMGRTSPDTLESRISKRFAMVPYPGFLVFNNTIIQPEHVLLTTPQPIHGRAVRELVNFRFFNNANVTYGMHRRKEWNGSLIEFYRNWNLIQKEDPHRKIISAENGKNLESIGDFGFQDCEKGDFRLTKNSPLHGKGTLAFEEADASSDIGAIPSGTDFELSAGPGQGVDERKLSPFQRRILYNPKLIFTTDKYNGVRGVYRQETPIILPLPFKTPFQGTLELILRITERSGEHTLLQAGDFRIAVRTGHETNQFIFRLRKQEEVRSSKKAEHGKQTALKLVFNKEELVPIFNGQQLTPVRLLPRQGQTFHAVIGKNPLYDLRIR